jgi:hypothetical protein
MTAVEQLIKEFQELKKTLLYPSSFKAVDECIDLCYAKLEMEKQQIIDAYVNGDIDAGIYAATKKNAEQYYNETFNLSQQDKP